ncbi:MAG: anaerobic sulfatase maturase [Candidatus Firestonebacteria bacterium]|nr:anaerobic sulfatase maturase [Candidatus Firestonebacteria bacterium]
MKNIELLIKPVSYDCNLKCGYCFYKTTEEIYPRQKHLMSDNTLETLISKTLSFSNGGAAVFSWQGGEPLLAGNDFFGKVISFQKKLGKDGQRVGNSVQTNGILLNTDFIKLFKEYSFFLGLSIDGDEATHNFFRDNSFKKTMKAADMLRQANLEFNILTVISANNVKQPKDLYEFYLKNNFNFVQLIPCIEGNSSLATPPSAYGEFLCKFFDLWYNNGKPQISVRFFDNLLELLAGYKPSYCGFKDKCNDYLVIEHNGDVYPCDFFVKKEWKLGNISENSIEELFQKAEASFGVLKAKTNKACKSCNWNYICRGGCIKYRLVNNNKYDDVDYFCEAYKSFFDHSIRKLQELANKFKEANSI